MGEPIATVGDLAGVCGHDGTDWIKALIDAAGHLQIDVVDSGGADLKDLLDKLTDMLTALQKIDDLQSALDSVGTDELLAIIAGQDVDVEVTQTTPADLVVAQHQYDGSAWRKSNLLWGFNAQVVEDLGGTVTGTAWTGDSTPVPANEVHVIQAVTIRNITRNAGMTAIAIRPGDAWGLMLKFQTTSTRYIPLLVSGAWVLVEGDVVRVYMGTCQADDVIEAGIIGYKMDIDM